MQHKKMHLVLCSHRTLPEKQSQHNEYGQLKIRCFSQILLTFKVLTSRHKGRGCVTASCIVSTQFAEHLVCFNIACEPWKVFSQVCTNFKFPFSWRSRCPTSRIIACSLESGNFRTLLRWFSCFQGPWISILRWWTIVFLLALHHGYTTWPHVPQ